MNFIKINLCLNNKLINWVIFIVLSVIWGSSFILMKEGLQHLTAYQVASLRIISSGIVLLPLAYKSFRQIPKAKLLYTFLSGTLGSLLPAYLFCIAEERLDSALAGVLNSLTPIFVILVGALFFKAAASANKVMGILIAFTGSIFLFLSQENFSTNSHGIDVLLIVIATIMYGININIVRRHLHEIPSIQIASLALSLNAIPAVIVLYYTGYFQYNLLEQGILFSTGYSFILGVCGTAIASVIFYMLIKRAGTIFSSMVTYAIPIVAIGWGIIYGEKIGWKEIASLAVILTGVWFANRTKNMV